MQDNSTSNKSLFPSYFNLGDMLPRLVENNHLREVKFDEPVQPVSLRNKVSIKVGMDFKNPTLELKESNHRIIKRKKMLP